MGKIVKDKYDLLTLATKGVLIGSDIHFEDGSLEIEDYYLDYATGEIHIEFTDGSGQCLDLKEKHVVSVPDTYRSVQSKKKFLRKPKRRK